MDGAPTSSLPQERSRQNVDSLILSINSKKRPYADWVALPLSGTLNRPVDSIDFSSALLIRLGSSADRGTSTTRQQCVVNRRLNGYFLRSKSHRPVSVHGSAFKHRPDTLQRQFGVRSCLTKLRKRRATCRVRHQDTCKTSSALWP